MRRKTIAVEQHDALSIALVDTDVRPYTTAADLVSRHRRQPGTDRPCRRCPKYKNVRPAHVVDFDPTSVPRSMTEVPDIDREPSAPFGTLTVAQPRNIRSAPEDTISITERPASLRRRAEHDLQGAIGQAERVASVLEIQNAWSARCQKSSGNRKKQKPLAASKARRRGRFRRTPVPHGIPRPEYGQPGDGCRRGSASLYR